jgi:CheY-like chemotaxis protein
MDREYDVFELSKGSPVWHSRAKGLLEARAALQQLSRKTQNECFVMHLPTKEIVARVNVSTDGKPVIVQVTYDHPRALRRTPVFRQNGYDVLTLIGNEAAKTVLSLPQRADVILLGHAAPDETRTEMVQWLRARYPSVPIIALNSPARPPLTGVDYEVKINGPETLLPVISTALHSAA